MNITDVSKVVPGPNLHHVDARRIHDSPHAMAVIITLHPGEALKKHITMVGVFFSVLKGTGIVEVGNEKKTEGKDMPLEIPVKIPHTWSNESTAVFCVLVVKVPKPTEETKLL